MDKNKGNTVKRTLDLKNPPSISTEQQRRLEAIAAMPDEGIDYSDSPYVADAVWMKAVDLHSETKKQITLRIDSDVIDFFKHFGKRYQTRINSVLRAYVDAQKKAHG